jgi:hypothetical protein
MKVYTAMFNNSTKILKTNNYVSSHVIEHKIHHDIQKCMARHKYVAGLNMLMGSQSTLLLIIGCQAAAHEFILFFNTVEQVI